MNIWHAWRDWVNRTSLGIRIVWALGLVFLMAWAFNDLDALRGTVRAVVIAMGVGVIVIGLALLLMELRKPLTRLFGVDK